MADPLSPITDPNDGSLNPSNWLGWTNTTTGQSGTFTLPGANLGTASGGSSGIYGSTISGGSSGNPLSPIAGSSPGLSQTMGATPQQQAATPAASGPGPTPGSLADYFARAVIVILGFIFVAIGLNMLRPGLVPDPRGMVRR